MMKSLLIVLVAVGLFYTGPAVSQSDDMAEQRSRIANQRIQAEAERVAELERQQAAEAERPKALEEAPDPTQSDTMPPSAATPSPPPAASVPQPGTTTDRLGMSRMLEHLRVLGQLRDSGYLTDPEFERIKARILDGEL